MMTLPELLSDPVRARIYIEVIMRGEVTAEQLLEQVDVKRSTLSHHLTRFVEERVLRVRVEETGRPVKHYSINPGFSEEIVIEGDMSVTRKQRIAFLESAAAHLHVASNLIVERADSLRSSASTSEEKLPKKSVTFTFNFLADSDAEVWLEEYEEFQKRLKRRLDDVKRDSSDWAYDYIAYGGLTPTRRTD